MQSPAMELCAEAAWRYVDCSAVTRFTQAGMIRLSN
jgi:hypothetical protein